MTAKARFTQADVTRAVKGAIAAGMEVTRVIIAPDGTIQICTEPALPIAPPNPWDDEL